MNRLDSVLIQPVVTTYVDGKPVGRKAHPVREVFLAAARVAEVVAELEAQVEASNAPPGEMEVGPV